MEWEHALIRTIDLIQPCTSSNCGMGWYVFDGSGSPKCPFCKSSSGKVPVLNLYSSRGHESYHSDNYQVAIWNGQSLYSWHINRNDSPNEHLTDGQRQRVGYFQLHNGRWLLVNQTVSGMRDLTRNVEIAVGSPTELRDGTELLLDPQDGGRAAYVRLLGHGGTTSEIPNKIQVEEAPDNASLESQDQ